MAKWMNEAGSDVHQGGDAPLMRAALSSERIPMMELLVAHGADVNAAWHGDYPILFAACEALSPHTLHWLLEHGSDPNCGSEAAWKARGIPHPGTALDYLLGTYVRDPGVLGACMEILLRTGGKSKHESRRHSSNRAAQNAGTSATELHSPPKAANWLHSNEAESARTSVQAIRRGEALPMHITISIVVQVIIAICLTRKRRDSIRKRAKPVPSAAGDPLRSPADPNPRSGPGDTTTQSSFE